MFDPEKCDHVPMNQKTEPERIIEQLREENELLKGCIMEICDVVFSNQEGV
ncbi:hypothetical protein [Oscillibacter sp.]|uniref:hypothetical protein n=1 Tax=Oscillibacter sp. TaxID=1945593 RepID=UPI002626E716|nr:hypothetical protein [Oscillibacter sp.]MDD3347520.1 hypothetical protein [Oscillibacter sp.]